VGIGVVEQMKKVIKQFFEISEIPRTQPMGFGNKFRA
jgi:hypothetical protein